MAIFCVKCGAKNPDGAQFCWRCGERLPRRRIGPIPEGEFVTPEEEERQFRQLLERAFELSERGEVDEAISACEEALKLRPTATTALSLLGSLYERKGERDRAVECYKKVLLLDPNAAAERERLRQLGEEAPVPEPSPPAGRRRARAIVGAASAALLVGLVVAVGVVGYGYVRSPREERRAAPQSGASQFVSPLPGGPRRMASAPPAAVPSWGYYRQYRAGPTPSPERAKAEREARPRREEAKERPKAATGPSRPERRPVMRPPEVAPSTPPGAQWRPWAGYPRAGGWGYSVRPPSAAGGASATFARRPVAGGRPRTAPEGRPPLSYGVGARPSTAGPATTPTAPGKPARATPSPPSPARPKATVTAPRPRTPSPEELAKAEETEGHRRYLEGDYRAAIAHYQRALRFATSSLQRAQLLQRLGDAYRLSGDFESAKVRYRNAIEEYRRAMREGATEEARRGIAACRAALEVIGG